MPTFDAKRSEVFARWLREQLVSATKRAAFSTATRLVGVIQNELIPNASPPPVFDGHYRSAWRPTRTADGADVVNDIPYAPIIEYGARPENIKIGREMIDALEEWVRRKGIAAGEDSRGVAWAIAQTFKKKGIFNGGKGLRIAEQARKRISDILAEEVKREVARVSK